MINALQTTFAVYHTFIDFYVAVNESLFYWWAFPYFLWQAYIDPDQFEILKFISAADDPINTSRFYVLATLVGYPLRSLIFTSLQLTE